ncbi:MAG: fructosamine kinase [Alphaproteobacteria bacterium]|nr:fructosamine kinase [Alphaproteobacteria bacterium]
MELELRIEALAGRRVISLQALTGGSVASVYKVTFKDEPPLVAKTGSAPEALECEAWMLTTLKSISALPVPEVVAQKDDLLLLSLLPADGSLDASAQTEAADLIAALHALTDDSYGLERDTFIGGLPQPNARAKEWRPFFAEHRLLHMARLARDAKELSTGTVRRIERLSNRLDHWLIEPKEPALLHGDLWTGNVLCAAGKRGCSLSGFIDPAIYYGDPEVELAYATMFDSFGDPFFARYQELRPIAEGFCEERRDLYTLYPLLVHVRLIGRGYADQVESLLHRFGA